MLRNELVVIKLTHAQLLFQVVLLSSDWFKGLCSSVKLPSLSRDLTMLYIWGHGPSNAKCCKPLLLFPAQWLFELWRFNDHVWGDGVKSRNNILITSKKQYFPRITDFFFFLIDSSFLDSATASGKGSGDLIILSVLVFQWSDTRQEHCFYPTLARFYQWIDSISLSLAGLGDFMFIYFFSFNVSLGIFMKEQGQLHICTGQEHLPVTEQQQQEHSPPASVEIKPCAAVVADLQHPLSGIQGGEWDTLLKENWWGRSSDRYFQELASWFRSLYLFTSRNTLNSLMVTSAPHD